MPLRNVYTSGRMAASFTSTVMEPVLHDELTPMSEEQIRQERWRNVKGKGKKAYVRLVTNLGNINLQLDCDLVPMTCHNFITLCETHSYDGVIFHRNIVSFMIQGGDPTGTGFGGESAWNGKFKDEFHKCLKHDERGIISMANSGPNTNGSQFFILYRASPHLDEKHSVFGRVVGGMDVINKMEMVPVDDNDRPKLEIKILSTEVFVNPFNDPLPHELKAQKEKEAKELEKKESERGLWFSDPKLSFLSSNAINATNDKTTDVGKYLLPKLSSSNHQLSNDRSSLHLPEPINDDNDKKKVSELGKFRFKNFSS